MLLPSDYDENEKSIIFCLKGYSSLKQCFDLNIPIQGWIKTEVEGEPTWRGGTKNAMESERAEGTRKFLGHQKIPWFFY